MASLRQMNLTQIANDFSGKGGFESETILCDANADRDEGFVSVWSNKSDLPKIIERCGSMIKKAIPLGDGYQLFIDRKAFRGIAYAFKKIDNGFIQEEQESKPVKPIENVGNTTKFFREPPKMPFPDEKMADIANNSANLGEVLNKIGWQDIKENRQKLSLFFTILRKTMKVKTFPRGRQRKG